MDGGEVESGRKSVTGEVKYVTVPVRLKKGRGGKCEERRGEGKGRKSVWFLMRLSDYCELCQERVRQTPQL